MARQDGKALIEQFLAALSGQPKPRPVIRQFVNNRELEDEIAIYEAAFPKFELVADDLVAEDDRVAVRATFRGVQLGGFHSLPPGGKSVALALVFFFRIADGKIVHSWSIIDGQTLEWQLQAGAHSE